MMDILKLIKEAIGEELTNNTFIWDNTVMDYFDNDQTLLLKYLINKKFDKIEIVLGSNYHSYFTISSALPQLPDNIMFNGFLDLKMPNLKVLPNGLNVKTLDCEETLVGKLPKDAVVNTFIPSIILAARKRRREKVWDPASLKSGDIGEKAHALFNHLKGDDIVEDLYDIIPKWGGKDQMTRFEILGSDHTYMVGTEDETDNEAKESVLSLIDGADIIEIYGKNDWVWMNNIKESAIEEYFEYLEHDIRDEPENWGLKQSLSDEQEKEIEELRAKIDELENKEERTDEEDAILDKMSEKIDYIEENPEGEVDEDEINQIIQSEREEATSDIKEFFENRGITGKSRNDFIDIDGVVEDVIASDGYGVIPSYDGDFHEERVNDTYYFIIRVD